MSSPSALGQYAITLGGVPLTVISTPRYSSPASIAEAADGGLPPSYQGAFAAQDMTLTLTKRDVPVKIARYERGCGFVRRRDQADDGGLAWVENGISWLGSGLMPAALINRLAFGPGLECVILGSASIGGDLYLITTAGFMLQIPTGDPSLGVTVVPPVGVPWNPSGGFRVGYHGQCITTFTDSSERPGIYIGTKHISNGTAIIYSFTPTDTVAPWKESGILNDGVDNFLASLMTVVYWTDETGAGAERLVIKSGPTEIRHCIQGNDPLDPLKYVSPTIIGNGAYPILGFAAFPQHLYVVKKNGIHDHNALRSENLTPYWEESAPYNFPSTLNNLEIPALAYDNFVVSARGFGMDRYDTRQGDGYQQRLPGECGPMFMMQDGTPIRGYVTAMCVYDGWILMALFNPDNQTTYIGRAKDRHAFDPPIDVPNPMVHYWAEAVIPPDAGIGWQVTMMRAVAVTTNVYDTAPPQTINLVMGMISGTGIDLQTAISWQQLPTGSGPLSLHVSQTPGTWTWRSAPLARFYLTMQDWDDVNANKYVRSYDIAAAGVPSGNPGAALQIFSRTDLDDLRTITDQSTWKSEGAVYTNSRSLTPVTETSAYLLGLQIAIYVTDPVNLLPVFQSISPRAKVVRQVFDTRRIWVLLQRDYALSSGMPDIREPDTAFATVTELQNGGRTTYVDEGGTTLTVYVEQGCEYTRAEVEGESGPEWRTVMGLDLTLLPGAA